MFRNENVLAFINSPEAIMLDQSGFIVGSLFERRGFQRVSELNPIAQTVAIGSRGASLIEDYWGSYVAVRPDPARATV